MKWLLDEMLPARAAELLRDVGEDAVSVVDIGLTATADDTVYEWAVHERRLVVTENFADYATLLRERQVEGRECVPIVFVRRGRLPGRGALPQRLTNKLVAWARANPEPVVGLHWP